MDRRFSNLSTASVPFVAPPCAAALRSAFEQKMWRPKDGTNAHDPPPIRGARMQTRDDPARLASGEVVVVVADTAGNRTMESGMIAYHRDMMQGSDEWLQARRGMLTASEVPLILTPALKLADNDKTRAHVFEIAAQRLTGHIEPHYISDDMLRGMDDEGIARGIYASQYARVEECGFIVNDKLGFPMGCSPDGLVGDDGMIEIKSRRQRFQVETIARASVPSQYVIQVQAELFITERAWVDYISYSNGMPLAVIRVEPDPETQEAIEAAAIDFERCVAETMSDYVANVAAMGFVPTERREVQEMF